MQAFESYQREQNASRFDHQAIFFSAAMFSFFAWPCMFTFLTEIDKKKNCWIATQMVMHCLIFVCQL